MSTNRRDFLKTGATAALGLSGFTLISPAVLGKSMGYVAPSDKVNLACIGIGNRGNEIIKELNKTGLCNVVALCDVDMGAKQTLEVMNMFPQAKKYQDFRKMFDEIGKEFDAVSIATPDFSHFPANWRDCSTMTLCAEPASLIRFLTSDILLFSYEVR